jgi:hypothetical protein
MELQRQINPDVIFMSKSHLDKARAEKLARKMKFAGLFCFMRAMAEVAV